MHVRLSFGTAAVFFAAALAAPAVSGQATSFQCMATSVGPGGSNLVIYVSQLIPGDMSQRATLTSAWGVYVKATYQVGTVASSLCNPLGPDPATQQRVIAAEQTAWQKKGLNVVQVNWSVGQKQNSAPKPNTNPYATAQPPADDQAKDAPAADAQNAPLPADPGPQPRSSYCYSDDKKAIVYFSDAFDTADLPNPNVWVEAFAKFLMQKYAYKGTVRCKDTDTIFNAQGAIRDQKDGLQGKQTVDTDWTYEPPAPGDPAAPAATPQTKKAPSYKPN